MTNAVVPVDVANKAQASIYKGTAQELQAGVELILKNNLADANDSKISVGAGQRDVTALLKKGLDLLNQKPFDALDIPIGSKTVDIRKAYKKLALK